VLEEEFSARRPDDVRVVAGCLASPACIHKEPVNVISEHVRLHDIRTPRVLDARFLAACARLWLVKLRQIAVSRDAERVHIIAVATSGVAYASALLLTSKNAVMQIIRLGYEDVYVERPLLTDLVVLVDNSIRTGCTMSRAIRSLARTGDIHPHALLRVYDPMDDADKAMVAVNFGTAEIVSAVDRSEVAAHATPEVQLLLGGSGPASLP
jgi:hypothetical protein